MGPSRKQIQASPPPAGLGKDCSGEKWKKPVCLRSRVFTSVKMNSIEQYNLWAI